MHIETKKMFSNSFEYIFASVSHLFKQCTFLFFGFHFIFSVVFYVFFSVCINVCMQCPKSAHSIFWTYREVSYKYILYIKFMFGLSLLNVRSRNNINVNFLSFSCVTFCTVCGGCVSALCQAWAIKIVCIQGDI